MTNVAAASTESTSTARGYAEIEDMALSFSIPVYLNMPENVCTAPEKAYNPNNWLKSLSVSDQNGEKLALTPTFDPEVKSGYSIFVENGTDSVKIGAKTASDKATVSLKSSYSLDIGDNVITIKVKAENGDVRKYKIHILREGDPEVEQNSDNTEETSEELSEETSEWTPEENAGAEDGWNEGTPDNADQSGDESGYGDWYYGEEESGATGNGYDE